MCAFATRRNVRPPAAHGSHGETVGSVTSQSLRDAVQVPRPDRRRPHDDVRVPVVRADGSRARRRAAPQRQPDPRLQRDQLGILGAERPVADPGSGPQGGGRGEKPRPERLELPSQHRARRGAGRRRPDGAAPLHGARGRHDALLGQAGHGELVPEVHDGQDRAHGARRPQPPVADDVRGPERTRRHDIQASAGTQDRPAHPRRGPEPSRPAQERHQRARRDVDDALRRQTLRRRRHGLFRLVRHAHASARRTPGRTRTIAAPTTTSTATRTGARSSTTARWAAAAARTTTP